MTRDAHPLSGKRREPREAVRHPAECAGSLGRLEGRTLDLSLGGMLLEVRASTAGAGGDGQGFARAAARIAALFPDGMDVRFGDGAVKVRGKIVRIAARSGSEDVLSVGCRFDRRLTDAEARLLGLDPSLPPGPPAVVPEEPPPRPPGRPFAPPDGPRRGGAR
jgi:hypothetical protein